MGGPPVWSVAALLTCSTRMLHRGSSGAGSGLREQVGGDRGLGVGDPGLAGHAVGQGQKPTKATRDGVFSQRWISELTEFLQ